MAAASAAPALSGVEKAAILLVVLGDQSSADLMKHLTDEEIELASQAIANLPVFTSEQAEGVLEEFRQVISAASQMGHGGVDFARKVLTNAFGPEGSKRHVERLPEDPTKALSATHQLDRADPQTLVRFVRTEHPQTVALILSHLSPAKSAAVLASMDTESRADLALRIAQLEQISPAVVGKISSVIGQKLRSLGEVKRESSGGPRAVAEIFNQLEATLSDEILAQIGEKNSEMMEAIRQKMFVFDDLLSIDANGIKEVLGRADRRQLTMALKGTSDELRQHLLQGMSQRGAAMLLEDMEALGPTKIRDVEAAQQQVIAVVRQLESEGLVSRNKSGGGGGGGNDEQYV